MLRFWTYQVLLYPYTTQFLNYTIGLHIKNYSFFIVYDALHLCSSTKPSFLCKNFQIYAGFFIFFIFFFTHEENISFFFFHISHSFQCGVI